jgi:peptide/nickel transport system ATP-binding protein
LRARQSCAVPGAEAAQGSELSDLRRELNLSILFICHDIALVQQFCDWVLVMYKGSIVEEGVPDEVIRNPQNDYTKRLIESIL